MCATGPNSEPAADRYTPASRQAVYDKLLQRASVVLAAGYSVIVDATFLRRSQRDAFRQLAERQTAPFLILEFDADPATLRQRIVDRQRAGADASEATVAVLEQQLSEREPLEKDEYQQVVTIRDNDARPAIQRFADVVER